ncbi:acyl-ACP--UDP-N-acetylglucosamine O-acyltransferase [Flavobacterium reichenbachii]|uniref:Acyl-ACP--UDP-N-acetylglucosamine O-acyltransferase n=1 Tax=Flavobacterium reichenbachii TaxID=362418 RepID=A0A085ZJL7_9FLAO|nr:acyl-ACP--UDP-N-acetylglucosamine O-acyltransferase [Flavobacterium reichenbachii]KFF04631.1 acyl-ACP--UDP-N- acetylglucosamine O-acyltransferase [Flavobacterium reichenbachii]OXB09826.1 acyl-[acyl-carrier-protein]--UDP-N-acetylglucosamine O-acyltransferase [Flavobacterium reichenbachii]
MKNVIIGKKASIGMNVRIGNFTTIENDVVIGDNTWIGNNVNILNGTRIGENCQIYSSAVLGGNPQDLKYNNEYSTLEIGNNNIIREFVTINKGTKSKQKTVIGSDNLIMSNAHIGHDCFIGNHCIIGFSVGMAGEVIVCDYVNISGLTAIHQFSVIGEHSIISGISRVVKDIPPYIVAAREPLSYVGLNLVGLKRRGFETEKLNELKEIYRIVFQQKRNTTLALEFIEKHFKQTIERDKIIDFIRNSTRGIIKGNQE